MQSLLSNSNDSLLTQAKKPEPTLKEVHMSKIKLTPSISNIEEQIGEESKSSLGEGTGSSRDPAGPSSLTSNKFVEAPKQT